MKKNKHISPVEKYIYWDVAVHIQKIHDPECKVISFIVDAYNSSHIIIGRRSPKSNESSYNLNLNHLRTQEGPLRKCL